MTIITKYNIGDAVWYLNNNKIMGENIKRIIIYVGSSENPEIYYETTEHSNYDSYAENKLFLSKEELIKSL